MKDNFDNILGADYWYDKFWRGKETKTFVSWFEKEYGLNSDYNPDLGEQEEYWRRRGFALMGWLGYEKTFKDPSNP